jgi:hypothetical protein
MRGMRTPRDIGSYLIIFGIPWTLQIKPNRWNSMLGPLEKYPSLGS